MAHPENSDPSFVMILLRALTLPTVATILIFSSIMLGIVWVPGPGTSSTTQGTWLSALLMLIAAGIAYAIYRRFGSSRRAATTLAPSHALLLGLGLSTVFACVSWIYFTLAYGSIESGSLSAIPAGFRLPELLCIAVLTAFIEEVTFRAWVIPIIATKLGPTATVLVSAVIFSVFHFSPDLGNYGLYLGVGLTLAVVWLRTRSLLACFVAHAGYNAFAYLVYAGS